jgi:hypothetical protein
MQLWLTNWLKRIDSLTRRFFSSAGWMDGCIIYTMLCELLVHTASIFLSISIVLHSYYPFLLRIGRLWRLLTLSRSRNGTRKRILQLLPPVPLKGEGGIRKPVLDAR